VQRLPWKSDGYLEDQEGSASKNPILRYVILKTHDL
jgi:hypothetical protein